MYSYNVKPTFCNHFGQAIVHTVSLSSNKEEAFLRWSSFDYWQLVLEDCKKSSKFAA